MDTVGSFAWELANEGWPGQCWIIQWVECQITLQYKCVDRFPCSFNDTFRYVYATSSCKTVLLCALTNCVSRLFSRFSLQVNLQTSLLFVLLHFSILIPVLCKIWCLTLEGSFFCEKELMQKFGLPFVVFVQNDAPFTTVVDSVYRSHQLYCLAHSELRCCYGGVGSQCEVEMAEQLVSVCATFSRGLVGLFLNSTPT